MTRKHLSCKALLAVLGLSAAPVAASAAQFTWDIAGGGNWSDPNNWKDDTTPVDPTAAYPQTSGDTARIYNSLPSGWPDNTTQTIVIDAAATGINGLNLDLRDDDSGSPPVVAGEPSNVLMVIQVNANAAFNRIDWFNDQFGAGRSRMFIASGVTLSVNTLDMEGRYPEGISSGGTLKFTPDGNGEATYNYFGSTEQFGGGITVDHSAVTEMNYHMNGGSAYIEGRDTRWIVGNTGGAQEWDVTNGMLQLEDRAVGNPWHFDRVGTDDVDMGKRTGVDASDGVRISRAFNGDHGGLHQRRLFTTAAGAAITTGEVKIADYQMQEMSTGAVQALQLDKIGSDLTVNGGSFRIVGRASDFDEVNMVWVDGRTLHIEGAAGHLTMDAVTGGASTSRRGVFFRDGTLDIDGNLQLLGTRTFLNDGGLSSDIKVGGNVTVNSVNPSGFASMSSLSGLASGLTATADDFDLRATTLTMDGGASSVISWTSAVVPEIMPSGLSLGDFGIDHFTLDTLLVTNNTNVRLAGASVLYLDTDLIINPGSVLRRGSLGQIHVLDPDLSEVPRILGYMADGRLPNWVLVQTPGVGFSLIPEPASMMMLAMGTLAVIRRRRV